MNRTMPALLGAALLIPVTASAALAAPAAARTAPLAGVAVYGTYGHQGYKVSRYEPGKGFTALGTAPGVGQFAASPDGTKVAWITASGKVQVKAGSTVTTVAKGAAGGAPCLTPAWSPDSAKVAFVTPGGKSLPVTVVNAGGSGPYRAGGTIGICHLAWSANGRYLAGYAGSAKGVYLLDLATRHSVKIKGVTLAAHVQSLSPDGRKVVVEALPADAEGMGDGSWPSRFTPTVLDTVTGRKTPIHVSGTLIGALYLPDGRLVVRVAGAGHNTLVVLDGSGRRLQSLAEPTQARSQALLQIVR